MSFDRANITVVEVLKSNLHVQLGLRLALRTPADGERHVSAFLLAYESKMLSPSAT